MRELPKAEREGIMKELVGAALGQTEGEGWGGWEFRSVVSVSHPHPYCITAKHVSYASRHGGVLSGEVIAKAESEVGARCGTCTQVKTMGNGVRRKVRANSYGRILSYHEHTLHKVAVVVVKGRAEGAVPEELQKWLGRVQEKGKELGVRGFSFPSEEQWAQNSKQEEGKDGTVVDEKR